MSNDKCSEVFRAVCVQEGDHTRAVITCVSLDGMSGKTVRELTSILERKAGVGSQFKPE